MLVHPAGANLRNLMAHGYIGQMSVPWCAVLIHCALMLATLELAGDDASETSAEDEPTDDTGGDDGNAGCDAGDGG